MVHRGIMRGTGRRAAAVAVSVLAIVASGLAVAPSAEATPVRAPVIANPVGARLPVTAKPAVAARPNAIASTASEALWSLWYGGSEFNQRLGRLVPLVAEAAEVSPAELSRAWSAASRERMIVLLSALTQVGVPYRKFQSIPGRAFDCSGLTSWAWSQVGVSLPRQSRRQIRMVRRSSKAEVKPGDLLYYPGHVMLALGVGQAMVHAPNRGALVRVSPAIAKRVQWMRVGSPLR